MTGVGSSENITAVADVGVEAVILSCYLNSVIFVVAILCFEAGRRYLPTIYYGSTYHKSVDRRPPILNRANNCIIHALNLWRVVHSIPWHTVLTCGGLDAYMFLRYIRLCGRVTSVSAFWGMCILGTVYGTAGGAETGWYRMSIKNIPGGPTANDNPSDDDDNNNGNNSNNGGEDWASNVRLWTTVGFMYMLTFYVTYLLSEEYKHYVELR